MNTGRWLSLQVGAGVMSLACSFPFGVAAQDLDAFRVSDMDLRDPHVFVNFIGCRDITDILFFDFSVNNELQTAIQNDGDDPPDGLLDLSMLVGMDLDQSLPTNSMQFGRADCTAPMESTVCEAAPPQLQGAATLTSAGSCLTPVAGSTRPYTPAITNATGPCFVSPIGNLLLDIGGLPVTLEDAQLAATFVDDPASNLSNGLLRGFLRESVADATIIPANIPLIGGQPLSSVLAGGTNACPPHNDKETYNGAPGWWFYFNFTAPRTDTVFPLPDLLIDGFE